MTKQISPLRQRMIDDMAFRNMSPKKQKVYAYAVGNFARFHRQSPDKFGLEHVRNYRLHLMSRGLNAASINPIGRMPLRVNFLRRRRKTNVGYSTDDLPFGKPSCLDGTTSGNGPKSPSGRTADCGEERTSRLLLHGFRMETTRVLSA
jgi:Phage integrase, N-terminal SAM-like domain